MKILRDPGDGLVLRHATSADVEALVAFNADVLRDGGSPRPDQEIAALTRDLAEPGHPTTSIDSTLIDTNLGHAFIWQWLDGIRASHPEVVILPIVLRCPLDVCLQRIQARYESDPIGNAPSDLFVTDSAIVAIWEYLSHLDRPDLQLVDAARAVDTVYGDVLNYINLHRIQGCTRVDRRAAP